MSEHFKTLDVRHYPAGRFAAITSYVYSLPTTPSASAVSIELETSALRDQLRRQLS